MQLVVQYDGTRFAGWQRQSDQRTVQMELEHALARLTDGASRQVVGAGRTDAGVHATGQAAGAGVPERWKPAELARGLNALLPDDVWISRAYRMSGDFHPRYSATSRTYTYHVGTDENALSPFRRRFELAWPQPLDRSLLQLCAHSILGEHVFRAFAVKGTAPETDEHRCNITAAFWDEKPGGLVFTVSANRFLHQMVRFLVGTMLDVASGRRGHDTMARLLRAPDNLTTPKPAPPHGLYLERVEYPPELYLPDE